jgi:nucleoside-diphosphate-sugar epimerase
MLDLTNKQIVVTGGRGFLDRHVAERFKRYDTIRVSPLEPKDYGLCSRSEVRHLFDDPYRGMVIHLAPTHCASLRCLKARAERGQLWVAAALFRERGQN